MLAQLLMATLVIPAPDAGSPTETENEAAPEDEANPESETPEGETTPTAEPKTHSKAPAIGTPRSCQRAFGSNHCSADDARKLKHDSTPSEQSFAPPLRKPKRFLRKFLRRCHRAIGNKASLELCFHTQALLVENDASWKSLRAYTPACPSSLEHARGWQRRELAQSWLTETGLRIRSTIEWKQVTFEGF
ncbi:MAG: hypothetical protein KC431_03850, partial [Myxococcales bacterium]|nr:hypothetical protein [Myxococcales bacterium]